MIAETKLQDGASEQTPELEIVTSLLSQLAKLDPETRERIVQTVATFYGFNLRGTPANFRQLSSTAPSSSIPESTFSEDRSISPKQFMSEKQPKTDVERVACLAYYLTHYRNTPHFKTLDISKLNTEAAQVKFSNAAMAVTNASARNFVVAGPKGTIQIGALGEKFVQALPDRDKATEINTTRRFPRLRKKARKSIEQGSES